MKTWSHKGHPDSPKAWLRKTAKNLLIDQHRRKQTYDQKIMPALQSQEKHISESTITDDIVEDSQLKMIFVVCNPILTSEAQLCLALRILIGFSIDEIAKALLSNKETINKKLYRAKQKIKQNSALNNHLTTTDYQVRMDNVLRIIYLIFNEGYYCSVKEETIRSEFCWEAMSLCKFLENKFSDFHVKVYALLALMCFHASRLDSRVSSENDIQLYHEQDRSKWNSALIKKGEEYLNKSATGNTISKYHIEAAIAYWHTTDAEDKYNNILQLYNKLLTMEYSPHIAMNRTYALALANSAEEALTEALKLNLVGNQYYYCLIAELYKMLNQPLQQESYLKKALESADKVSEKQLIQKKLKQFL